MAGIREEGRKAEGVSERGEPRGEVGRRGREEREEVVVESRDGE